MTNPIRNGVYGIVDVKDDPVYGAVGVMAFLTHRFSWFSPQFYLNTGLDSVCVEPIRNRWRNGGTPHYVRFVGTSKVYRYRGSGGLWYGRSRSLLIPVTHPSMR